MGNPSLIAKLGIDEADFKRGLAASSDGLKGLQENAKITAAQIALLERQMKSSGETVELTSRHKALQTSLRETQLEAKKTATQLAALEAVQGRGGGGSSGISRMGKMELGHVGMALGGSLAAGVPIEQGVLMEAPRLIEALGPAALKAAGGLSSLLAGLSGLVVAALAAAGGIAVYSADREADKQRLKNSTVGTAFDRRGDTVEATNKELLAAEQDEKDTRHKRHSKKNHWANLFGRGMQDDDVEEIRKRKIDVRDRRDEAGERDADLGRRQLDGDPKAEQDKLSRDFEAKKTAIYATRAKDADRLVAIAKTEYETASAELKRRQDGIQTAVDLETQIVQIKKEGYDVENKIAAAKIAAAQKDLANGPKEGPEHDKNVAAVGGAEHEGEVTARDTAEREVQRKDATDLAGLTGDQPAWERSALLRKKSDLEAQTLDTSSPTYEQDSDKRADRGVEFAQTLGDLHTLDRGDKQREFQRRQEDISTDQQRGAAGEIKAIDQHLGVNKDEQADNKANEKSLDVAARLNAEAAELQRRKDEIVFSEKESLETLERQGDEIKRHGLELDAAGKRRRSTTNTSLRSKRRSMTTPWPRSPN